MGVTLRQKQIIRLAATGATHKEMAKLLNVAPETIRNHISALFPRLQAKNMPHAVAICFRKGIIR